MNHEAKPGMLLIDNDYRTFLFKSPSAQGRAFATLPKGAPVFVIEAQTNAFKERMMLVLSESGLGWTFSFSAEASHVETEAK